MDAKRLNKLLFVAYRSGRVDSLRDLQKWIAEGDFTAPMDEEMAVKINKKTPAQAVLLGASTLQQTILQALEERMKMESAKRLSPDSIPKAEALAAQLLDPNIEDDIE